MFTRAFCVIFRDYNGYKEASEATQPVHPERRLSVQENEPKIEKQEPPTPSVEPEKRALRGNESQVFEPKTR